MKVKDFLEMFKDANPEAEMVFAMNDGCCSDTMYLEEPADDTSNSEFYHLRFPAIEHFSSCRKSAMMYDTLKKYKDDQAAFHEGQRKAAEEREKKKNET
jgi:hypothetical protein